MIRRVYIFVLSLIGAFLLGLFVWYGMNVGETYCVTFVYGNGKPSQTVELKRFERRPIELDLENEPYTFAGWFFDAEFQKPVPNGYRLTEEVTLYAKWDAPQWERIFYVDGQVYAQSTQPHGATFIPEQPEKEGYYFAGWSTSDAEQALYDVSQPYTQNLKLYACWETKPFTVNCVLGFETFSTKEDLYRAYFTDFYNFMKENTNANFAKYGISDVEDFLLFCKDWNADGHDEMGGIGYAFADYYVDYNVGSSLEDQPTDTFIGYCYQNNRYRDFLPHLIQFFAYWRTDEGYTGGPDDPKHLGNDFFASPWGALVDTAKFFYFTSENLNDKYAWFQSQRVKDALDNIPGVGVEVPSFSGVSNEPVDLPEITREGYRFLGWFDSPAEDAAQVNRVWADGTVYAKWEKLPT